MTLIKAITNSAEMHNTDYFSLHMALCSYAIESVMSTEVPCKAFPLHTGFWFQFLQKSGTIHEAGCLVSLVSYQSGAAWSQLHMRYMLESLQNWHVGSRIINRKIKDLLMFVSQVCGAWNHGYHALSTLSTQGALNYLYWTDITFMIRERKQDKEC